MIKLYLTGEIMSTSKAGLDMIERKRKKKTKKKKNEK